MHAVLLFAATFGAFTDQAKHSTLKQDLETYQAARAKAGKSADAHVRLALWCEAHGLSAERMKHLATGGPV